MKKLFVCSLCTILKLLIWENETKSANKKFTMKHSEQKMKRNTHINTSAELRRVHWCRRWLAPNAPVQKRLRSSGGNGNMRLWIILLPGDGNCTNIFKCCAQLCRLENLLQIYKIGSRFIVAKVFPKNYV